MTHVMQPARASLTLSLFLQNILAVRELGARRMLFDFNSFDVIRRLHFTTASLTTKARGYLHGF